ncbi:MAG: hypothetical protein ACIPMY_06440 [Rickettsia endosymbiont of Pentastiridius leporinus]
MLCCFLAFIATGCTKTTSVRHVSGYNKSMLARKEILVLPMQTEVYTLDAGNRKERKYDYEDHLEELLKQEIILAAQKKGLRVKLLRRKDIRDQKLDDLVSRFRKDYNNAYTTLYTPLLWAEEKAFSITQNLNDSAVILGEKTGGDVFLLIDYAQMIKTNGARTKDFLMQVAFGCSASNSDNLTMSIGIVDATRGRVLCTNTTATPQPFSTSIFCTRDKSEVENFHRVINSLLSQL